MAPVNFGNYIIRLDSVDSTNSYASQLLLKSKMPEGAIVITSLQESGRGQRESTWESEQKKNLAASFILYPKIDVSNFFYLNECVSLAVQEAVSYYTPGKQVSVKWPNDVMIGNAKVGGILIENSLRGNQFAHSIVGVGININQESFREYLPRATSFILETGRETPVEDVLKLLCTTFSRWYDALCNEYFDRIHSAYIENLFRLGAEHDFEFNGKKIKGTIKEVSSDGKLILERKGNQLLRLNFKEIRYLF